MGTGWPCWDSVTVMSCHSLTWLGSVLLGFVLGPHPQNKERGQKGPFGIIIPQLLVMDTLRVSPGSEAEFTLKTMIWASWSAPGLIVYREPKLVK